jgi:hypothetical protein
MNYLKDLEKMQVEKCNKSRITSETPRQEGAECSPNVVFMDDFD